MSLDKNQNNKTKQITFLGIDWGTKVDKLKIIPWNNRNIKALFFESSTSDTSNEITITIKV